VHHTFETTGPTSLFVEIGSGDVAVRADQESGVHVEVLGDHADDVTVEQRGDRVVVIAPQRAAFFGRGGDLDVRITCPHDSDLATQLGSADLVVTGVLGGASLKAGSGDVDLEAANRDTRIETGSGDIQLGLVAGDLRVKAGSGDVTVRELGGSATISTGSGDVQIEHASGDVQAKTGSGDLHVRRPEGDVLLSTASGDLTVDVMGAGQLAAKNVSGDIRVGVAGGLPVWTDVTTLTGTVSSTLAGAGQPAEGDPYLELHAKTVSGDIYLEQR
jgi:DUF4097 and DUF4098 domain-containing protein YvlB